MNAIVQALGLLTPFDIDVPKMRIGPPKDGGYVLADRIEARQNVVSYGISCEYRFDEELATRGHRVYMFDHTIDGIATDNKNMIWLREGVAAKSDASQRVYTIEDHLRRHAIDGNDLLMQMDVEGAEIDVLGTTPGEVLGRFEQIVVELHELGRLREPAFRRRVVRMLKTLNHQFTLFHVHDNNFVGGGSPYIVAGLPCVSVIELSYIRTDLVHRRPSKTLYPTIHDYPNAPETPEKKLWFFPFLPSRVSIDSYAQNAARLDELWPIDEAFDTTGCVDIAVGKPASQSSLSVLSMPDDARGAVSGRISGTYSFHTDCEEQAWWQVDLGAEYAIDAVVIYNRGDACAHRAYDFVLKIAGDTNGFTQVYDRHGRPFGNEDSPACIPLGGRPARHVRVQLAGKEYLHLDAVKVFVRRESIPDGRKDGDNQSA